jgi:hypothetical protein
VSGGGNALPEAEKYIPYYLSNRPVKIFDIQNIEIEMGQEILAQGIKPSYRPRPLAYLADDLRLPDMPAGADFTRVQTRVLNSRIYDALHKVMTESH